VLADLGKGRIAGEKDVPQKGFDAADMFLEGPFSGG
jgi:hypothetical protein